MLPNLDFQKYTTVKRSRTERALIQTAASSSNRVEFSEEYCFFKIACVDPAGIPALATLQPRINNLLVYNTNSILYSLLNPGAGFIWDLSFMSGTAQLSLALSAVATADVEFQITGYERVEY